MIPRWVIILAIVIALIWVINDPKGAGEFIHTMVASFGTFFKNIG